MGRFFLRLTLPVGVIVLLFFSLTGCAGVMDATMGVGSAIDKGTQKVSGAAERAVMDATGISAMQDAMVASVVYSYAFFAGGYMPGYDDFEEGEGVKWKITVSDEEGEESATIERALLKRLPGEKEWWFLSYTSGEEVMVAEALLTENYEIEIFRYRDPETEEIKQWIPEKTEDEEYEDEADEETEEIEEAPDFYSGDWEDNIVGRETITVPAGSYTADHVLLTMEYETGSEEEEVEREEVTYEWWISEEAPGNLVRYRWTETSEESEYLGELIAHGTGYTSQLDSF